MDKQGYNVTVTGGSADREKLAGKLVMNAANLVTGIRNDKQSVVFFFRFRGDAALVLKLVSRSLRVRQPSPAVTVYGTATATIGKN